jgi:Zn-dependent M28 family amino/carboxypeptidase
VLGGEVRRFYPSSASLASWRRPQLYQSASTKSSNPSLGVWGRALSEQVIIVSAYHDGLGDQPDGILYPGANDNASGVARMLEMPRQLMASPYEPKKTVMFVAWAGIAGKACRSSRP